MHIILGTGIKNIKEPFPRIANLKHGRQITTPVAIVRGAPYRAQTIIIQDLKTLLTQLMRSKDVAHSVHLEEFTHDLRAKCIPGTARTQTKLVAFGIRVAPDEVGHGAFVGNFAEAVDDFDLVDRVDGGAEAAVDTEDLVVDDDGEGQVVEHVGEVVPDVCVAVLAAAFRVEAVALRYAAGFVVAADEVHAVGVAEFEADEEGDGFDAEEAAVDIVAWGNVRLGRFSG